MRFLGSIRKPDPAHPCVPVRLEFSSSDDLDLYHQIVRRDGFGDLNRHFTFEAGEPLPGLFPWPGGKAKVAPVVWSRFGLVDEYWEPFVGSAAVFLARPGGRYGREILNDHNSDVVNVHQTAKLDPTGLVEHLETPLSHVAMEVNARILRQQRTSLSRMLRSALDYCDTRLAALFLVNACGQMRQERYSAPHPVLSANGGQGVFSQGARPHQAPIISAISKRLHGVEIQCRDWRTISLWIKPREVGVTGVFLDPPYDGTARATYGCRNVAQGVRRWAIKHGEHPNMRIALCGRKLEMPDSWSFHQLTGHLGPDRDDEEVWFSPACLPGGAS